MLCNDRIIKKIWWQKKEILYKDIEKIIINASYFDAYKIGKAINPQVFKKLEKYQIFDVWIISSKCNIHFKTKWFDSIRQINYFNVKFWIVISLLMSVKRKGIIYNCSEMLNIL